MMKRLGTPAIAVFAFLSIISACTIDTSEQDETSDNLYQVSTISALSAGSYDGLITAGELLDEGDFGLGTFDALDGEMIVYEGTVYRVPADGIAVEVDGAVTTPFAAVTEWDPDAEHQITTPMACSDLQAAIDGLLESTEIPYAVKVEGAFSSLTTRSEERQEKPYAALSDVLANQIEFNFTDVSATMVGFRLPDYMANSNSAGYHFHALTEDREAGGHVLDCRTTNAVVEFDMIDFWQVDLTGDD
ncbi:MAG: acetolactate decarboxylase [Thermomicrobiales bacterium]